MSIRPVHRLIAVLIPLIVSGACADFLDQVPDDRQTMEDVFKKKVTSEQYLANVYSFIRDEANQWEANPWTANSDELIPAWNKYATHAINIGNWDAVNSPFSFWAHYYRGIRSATYFINNIDNNTEILQLHGKTLIDQYKAEARFLRAYYYFMLLRQYGPVIIIGDHEVQVDAPSSSVQLPRSTYDVCVNYVASELDQAAEVLPIVPSSNGVPSDLEFGRATRGAALAVKSRMLLYAASPFYNGNRDMANFTSLEGEALINQNYDKEKWKRAADAAKSVIELGIYNLYKDPDNDPVASYRGIHLDPWNKEILFARKANDLPNWDIHCNPRQAGGWCGMAPTQEMVDAYLMKDGLPIKDEVFSARSVLYAETGFTNGVHNMYINREPRFYASITYNRSQWQGGSLTSPATIVFEVSGPNSVNGHTSDWSKTGYLVRKNVSPNTNAGSGGTGARFNRPLVLFRLGEIYLNYAEALNEYEPGNTSEIFKYINLIRERAGVPQYGVGIVAPSNQEAMRQAIRRERRIELAFEYQRWFDVRRWKIAEQSAGELHGMNIYKDGNEFYQRVVIEKRAFRPEYYLFPIRQYELDRAKLIVQNPGW
jgi:hypothetical protein